MADIPPINPPGAPTGPVTPPKRDTSKVQPKKDTVSISLPPLAGVDNPPGAPLGACLLYTSE